MIRSLTLLVFLVFVSACSLIHDDLPNESPTLQVSRAICQSPEMTSPDTIISGSDQFCRVRRGGEIRLEVRAADEDDDPLVYRWNSYGAGGFRDSTAKVENSWFAPTTILGDSEQFLIQVVITDRDCTTVANPNDRQRCDEDAQEIIENFLIEVVQRRPVLTVIADTTLLFSQPQFSIDAFATDPDGDPIEYRWQQLAGPDNGISIAQSAIRDEETTREIGSRATIIPFLPGTYQLQTSASDGTDPVLREITVQIPIEPPLPAGGMVRLTLPSTGAEFEIDIYEYPNVKGELPLQATFFQAVNLCAMQGKRLCGPSEWQQACQGDAMSFHSSSDDPLAATGLDNFGIRFCNVANSAFARFGLDLEQMLAPAGSFPNCGGTTGVFDLIGNLSEWTASLDAANDLEVSVIRSDVIVVGNCSSRSPAGTLALGGASIYDPEVLQSFVDDLNPDFPSSFEQGFVGFRCCR